MSWKRLESATVDPNLSEGLEARVADPLWMLARQWQTGEFKGNDAANPLLVRLEAKSVRIERLVLPGGHSIELNEIETPLEPLVEREPVREGPARVRVAAELGRLLIRSLIKVRTPRVVIEELRRRYPVALPEDDGLDPAGRRRLELLARAGLHGVALGAALTAQPQVVELLLDDLGVADSTKRRVAAVIDDWERTAGELFSEPEHFSTWNPERMEYSFELQSTALEGRKVELSVGDGYAGGRLDWHAFDRADTAAVVGSDDDSIVHHAEVLPAPLRFRGMPAARFWEFEEGDVYLGGIEAAPEDLARVAVAAYGVIYGDDWLIVPIRLPYGTLTEVTEVTVLDDFGVRSTISAAAVVDGGTDRRAFKFFELTGDSNPRLGKAPLLFLPPTVETTDAGRPLEDVRFMRDQIANVAWAVEHRIESMAGRPVDVAARRGSAAATPESGTSDEDAWRFVLSTPVPGHWVPLIPVRLVEPRGSAATDGTIMFQRGRIPVTGDPGSTRGALGSVLTPQRRLLIHEEEIPMAGIRVVRRFQSARDTKGRLHTWVGRRKGPGRGDGHSGLVFDDLDRTPSGTKS